MLLAAKKPKSASAGKKKKKKRATPTGSAGSTYNKIKKNKSGTKDKAGNKKSDGKTSPLSSSPSRASQINNAEQKKKQQSFSPPWQVVSKKDRANNVRAEQQRRQLAKEQGIHTAEHGKDGMKISRTFLSNEDKALLAWKRFKLQQQIHEVDFIGAYLNKQLPPRLGAPEVAFLGRSNVGKSSLLNKLVNSDTARVGKTPGATASVNLYGIFNKKEKAMLGLVDLPGFGYAKLSKETKESVQIAAETYLSKRKELVLGILLVDIRRVPSDDDRAVLAALYDSGVPILVVATKIDKVSKTDQEVSLEIIRNGLGLPEGQPLFVSSVTGQGIKDLWRIIMEACEGGVEELRRKMLEQGGEEEEDMYYMQGEDGEEIAYSQGFDWIHDSESVMYEDENGESAYVQQESWGDDNDDGGEGGDIDYDDYDDPNQDLMVDTQQGDMPRRTLRDLKKQAKEMEKRGDF